MVIVIISSGIERRLINERIAPTEKIGTITTNKEIKNDLPSG